MAHSMFLRISPRPRTRATYSLGIIIFGNRRDPSEQLFQHTPSPDSVSGAEWYIQIIDNGRRADERQCLLPVGITC
jgi:hypothetical protein